MSDKSAIEWTDATWNPLRAVPDEMGADRWYCQKISPGCDNCYASRLNRRFGGHEYQQLGTLGDTRVELVERIRTQPYGWKRPRMIFVCSMTDLFGDWVPDEWILKILDVMVIAKHHTFQVLTKRPKRMRDLLSGIALPPNIWVGTSIESDRYVWRANHLRQMHAAVTFISAEPLLEALPSLDLTGISWIITGGESGGPPARAMVEKDTSCSFPAPGLKAGGHSGCWTVKPWALEAVCDLRDRAQANGTAFFHKQWGGPSPKSAGRLLDGREWSEFPGTAEPPAGRGAGGSESQIPLPDLTVDVKIGKQP